MKSAEPSGLVQQNSQATNSVRFPRRISVWGRAALSRRDIPRIARRFIGGLRRRNGISPEGTAEGFLLFGDFPLFLRTPTLRPRSFGSAPIRLDAPTQLAHPSPLLRLRWDKPQLSPL